jgi:hypothetical protein
VPLTRLAALLLSVAALGFAAAGCGGGGDSNSSSGESPEEWAADVCGALGTWTDDLKAKSDTLSSDLRSSSDFKSVKEKLVAFIDDAKASTQKMVDDVKAAGPPATDNGESVQEDLEAGLTEARDTLDNAADKAQDLDTSDPRAFVSGVTSLAQQVQTELQGAAKHFEDIEDTAGELDDAIKDEPACQPFLSSSSSG